jgi:hypothetical protein
MDDRHTLELVLLQEYYAKGSAEALAALVAFYLDGGYLEEARYFWRRRSSQPSGEPWATLESLQADGRLAAGDPGALSLVARDPLSGALDFETADLAGWQGDVAVYHSGPSTEHRQLAGVRGFHAGGALSSGGRAEAVRGTITSPPFVLKGRQLTLLIGGGSRRQRVGVELLVEDTVLDAAHGLDGEFLFPWLYDITAHQGKTARLRVFDRSKDSHVLVDRVLLWD